MTHFRLFVCLILMVTIMVMTIGCSHDLAGATTETTNGITGVIHNSDNTPSSHAVVSLFPDDYDPIADSTPGTKSIDTTDINGNYHFNHITKGRYVVLARNSTRTNSFLLRGVNSTDDSITTVPTGTMNRSGAIATNFSLCGTVASGYVFIPGTDIYSQIGVDGSVLLGNVPPGTVQSVILASTDNPKHNVLRDEITVTAGITTTIEQPLLKYRRNLRLNTTTTGANVSGDVLNFPLLIRLNSSNFDFSQARTSGEDLVFTSKNNTVLHHEIERWDVAAKRAEIWVKVDTIHGNDSTQSIFMYWGNSTTVSQEAIGKVFDTTDGYQGVWHFGETAQASVHDATINKYDGSTPDSTRPQVAEGVIGNCRLFNGTSNYITMPNTANSKLNFAQDGNYTVCAWVLLDTLDNASHCIVSKGFEQYYLRSTYISVNLLANTPQWEFVEFNETVKWQTSTYSAQSKQWAQLVGVRQGKKQLLYCNGVLVDSTIDVWQNAVSRNTTNDLIVGRFSKEVTLPISEGYCYFKGSIDEVRILNAVQSPDWVRLCYMNQRPDDHLVMFR